jgi:NAD(P)-dependent dehydrogenase (short-subunit alcohol dehydrogenase family)
MTLASRGARGRRTPRSSWRSCRGVGVRVAFREEDLRDPDAAKRIVAWAESEIGPLGALVVAHTHSGLGGVLDTNVAEWDRHLDVNARGAFGLCAAFASRWSGVPGSGRIVVYTSRPPLAGEVAYAASKGALEWLVLSLGAELAPRGITVNAVDPGPTDTGWLDQSPAPGAAAGRASTRAPRPARGLGLARGLPVLRPGRLGERPSAFLRRGLRVAANGSPRARALLTDPSRFRHGPRATRTGFGATIEACDVSSSSSPLP